MQSLFHHLSFTSFLSIFLCPLSKCTTDILTTQLRKLNQIEHRGKVYPFSDVNIQTAVAAISQFPYDALYTTSTQIYDLLVLGKSLEQTIDGGASQ
jgi:hypothetical protein